MSQTIEQVKEFARQAHGDQQRKFAAEPYINHPIRVMETCTQYTDDITVLSAALLHDVLEDTDVDKERILEFLQPLLGSEKATTTVKLIEELTDIYTKKNYPQWNRKKRKAREAHRLEKTSAEAQTIKYADIIDNSIDIAGAGTDFAKIFLTECRNLLKTIPNGDHRLYQVAIEKVNDSIKKL
jgi:(p)ppGpp synthase/HD superfamily hydrolase